MRWPLRNDREVTAIIPQHCVPNKNNDNRQGSRRSHRIPPLKKNYKKLMRQNYLPGVSPVLVTQYRVAKLKTIDNQKRTVSGGCNHVYEYVCLCVTIRQTSSIPQIIVRMYGWREKREGELWLLFN